MKVVLHIGMPKCGSSALQTYLSSEQFVSTCGKNATYAAVFENGAVIAGRELIEKAAVSPFGYCSSHTGKLITGLEEKERKAALNALKALGQEFNTVILSHEGWGPHPQHFPDDCLFSDGEFEVEVVAYVRPQVEWMNSAWWQWGAWTEAPLMKWVNHNRAKAQWAGLLEQWSDKPWVKEAKFRLLEGDVVQDFMAYLGYRIPAQMRSNQSLPETVLRLFQRNRQLRPGAHDAAIEFTLSRHLKLEAGKNPWVLRPKMVEVLLAFYQEDNRRLLELLPVDQRQRMTEDPRWWSVDAYAQRKISRVEVERLDISELEKLAVSALETIHRLDTELRQTRHGIGQPTKR